MRRVALVLALALAIAHPAAADAPALVAGSIGGDGGDALRAGLRTPTGLAIDGDGDLLIADGYHNGLRRIRAGVIANAVHDTMPSDVAVGPDGAIVWSDLRLQVVGPPPFGFPAFAPADLYRLSPGGVPERIAGNGRCGASDDGAAALTATICPAAVALAPDGAVAFAEPSRVRAITDDGTLRTLAAVGAGTPRLRSIAGIAYAPDGTLYVADPEAGRILRVGPDGATSAVGELGVEGAHPAVAGLQTPIDVAIAPDGTIYAVDRGVEAAWPLGGYRGSRVVRIDASSGRAVPLAVVDGAVAITVGEDAVYVSSLSAYGASHEGTAYTRTRAYVHRIERVTGTQRVIAGSGTCCYAGEGGPAVHAELGEVTDISLGPDGSIWLSEDEYDLVRRIDGEGRIRLVVGNDSDREAGRCCLPELGGPDPMVGADRPVDGPRSIVFDAQGRAYVLEATGRVLQIDPVTGISQHVPGVEHARALGSDPSGRLYVASRADATSGTVVARLDPGSGALTTVAGGAPCGSPDGDGGPALEAALCDVGGLVGDTEGNLFISESSRHRIRRVNLAGTIETIAGNGSAEGAGSGDGGPALDASIPHPRTLRLDAGGNLYVESERLRVIRPLGTIDTILGARAPFALTPAGELLYATHTQHFDIDHAHAASKVWRIPLDLA